MTHARTRVRRGASTFACVPLWYPRLRRGYKPGSAYPRHVTLQRHVEMRHTEETRALCARVDDVLSTSTSATRPSRGRPLPTQAQPAARCETTSRSTARALSSTCARLRARTCLREPSRVLGTRLRQARAESSNVEEHTRLRRVCDETLRAST